VCGFQADQQVNMVRDAADLLRKSSESTDRSPQWRTPVVSLRSTTG